MEEIVFPNQIRMIRRTRGKTMKEIADVLGVSLSAISKIEKGYRRIGERQLDLISKFLNCPQKSIFAYEQTSQPEVLKAWQKEKDRRKQINEKSGLKTLGAGLRHIRGEKMLTLKDVAKGAGLTLSVYHRIEMGQREVTEKHFKQIAHALGHTTETLQLKIYELDMAGALQGLKKTDKTGVFHPKGEYNDLPISSTAKSFYQCIPVYDSLGENLPIIIDSQTPLDYIDPGFQNKGSLYAIRLSCKRLGYFLPTGRTLLIADKNIRPCDQDLACLHTFDNRIELGFCKKEAEKLVFMQYNPESKMELSEDALSKMDKILYIHID